MCVIKAQCDLQDQSLYYGVDKSRFVENKRDVKKIYGTFNKNPHDKIIFIAQDV